jgi:uncharacterized protein (DUF111 family)
VLVSVQAAPADAEGLEGILFAETPTLGVRRSTVTRTVLEREESVVDTPWGPVAGKVAYLPDGSRRFAAEYEACRELAERSGVPLAEVMRAAGDAGAGMLSRGSG